MSQLQLRVCRYIMISLSALFTGVLAGASIHKMGNRAVLFIGSIITALGLVLSVFAPNVITLHLTFGVIAGKFFSSTFTFVSSPITSFFSTTLPLDNTTVCPFLFALSVYGKLTRVTFFGRTSHLLDTLAIIACQN